MRNAVALALCILAAGCGKNDEQSAAPPPDAAVPNGRDRVEAVETDCPHDATCQAVPATIELPAELAQLEAIAGKCLGGNNEICHKLSAAIVYQFKTPAARRAADAAMQIAFCGYRSACMGGDASQCTSALELIPPLRHDRSNTRSRCQAHYSKNACLAGAARECGRLAAALRKLSSPRAVNVLAHAIAKLTKACEGGDSTACVHLAKEYDTTRKRGSAAAYRFYEKAAALDADVCSGKSDADACSRAGDRYRARPLADWKRARVFFTKACKLRGSDSWHDDCRAAQKFGFEISTTGQPNRR